MAEAKEPEKTVRVVGHNAFHLRHGHKKMFPTANLGGGKDVPASQVHKQAAYIDMHAKLAAELSTAEREADPALMQYWQNQALEAEGRQLLTDDLTKQLGRAPAPEEVEAAWAKDGVAATTRARHAANTITGDPSQMNLDASVMRQNSGGADNPAALDAAHQRNFEALQSQWNQLTPEQQAAYGPNGAPRFRAPGTVEGGAIDPNLFSAGNKAYTDKAKMMGGQADIGADSGMGFAGTLAPIARALPGWGGALANIGAQTGTLVAPRVLGDGDVRAGVDRKGAPVANVGTDAAQAARAGESNTVANLIHDYNAATVNGDTVGAARIADQIRQNHGVDPTQIASNAVAADNARGGWHGVGSAAFEAATAPTGLAARPGFSAAALRNLPVVGAIQTALPTAISAATGAWRAKPGERLQGAWDAAKSTLPAAAEGAGRLVGTGAAINAALPELGGAGGTTWASRLAGLRAGLGAANPLVTGTGARAAAGKAGIVGTLMGGVNAGADLFKHYTSEDARAADDAQVKNQALADTNSSTGGRLLNAAGAGAQILGGNIEPARRQFGAAWGRLLPNTPAGRNVEQAQRESEATTAGSEARRGALATLQNDPRFANMDPNVAENLGNLASGNAEAAAQLNHGRDADAPATVDHFQQYSQARLAQAAGKATPQQLQYLSELAGEPISATTPMNGAQQGVAGRNAALYHHLGAGNARQLLQGNVAYRTPEGANGVARGAVNGAVGVPADTKPMPQQPAPAAAAQPPKPAAPPAPAAAAPAIKPIAPIGAPKVAAEFVGQPPAATAPVSTGPLPSPSPAPASIPTAPVAPANAAAAPKPTAPLPPIKPVAPAPAVPTTVVNPAAPAVAPAQAKVDYKALAADVVNKSGPERDQALQKYVDWANTASPEERAAGRDALLHTGMAGAVPLGGNWLADRAMSAMTDAQKNEMILNRFRQAGTDVGNGVSEAAKKEWSDKGGGLTNWLTSNPSMMLLPLGIALAIGGGNKTKMLGLMAAAGGAYNLFSRYQAVQNPAFLKAVQNRVASQKAGTWNPENEAQFSAQFGEPWKDLQAAQAGGLVNIPQQAGQAAADMIGKTLPGYNAPTAGAHPIPAAAPPPAPVKP